ncbi:hypothetical protein [Halomarina rubra]|uniref:Uncharacterized protein n=1 Tax=Halomarina rubra TaxID=2071873 RepID=A0ABD6B0X0_9EURY|nr:hypothetical protein [Halomarina rubra]
MALLEALVIFVVGYVSGTITRWFAGVAAILALLLAILGLAAPGWFLDILDPLFRVYAGNELLFLSGFLFAIAHRERGSD